MMSVPGLALFYGGLVRGKNMLSVLMQVLYIVCVVGIIWVLYGYSLAFTNGGGAQPFVGGFSKALLNGVGLRTPWRRPSRTASPSARDWCSSSSR